MLLRARTVLCHVSRMVALVGLLACSAVHAADSIEQQRSLFKQAYAQARLGDDGWRTTAESLRDYPLYPYLEAAALTHDLRQLDRAPVEAYLKRYPGLIPAQDLRRDFLLELARRKDWATFLALYQPDLGDTLACDALQARMAQGVPLDFDRDLALLWQKPELPDSCDAVLVAAQGQGLLTPARLWQRIDRAVNAGKAGTVAALAYELPAPEQAEAQRLALALRDPAAAVAAASSWTDTPRDRLAVAQALQRLARRQSTQADSAWQALQQRFAFSDEQRNATQRAIALFHATDFDPNALQQLMDLPASAQSDGTREWRVRIALSRLDWQAVLDAIEAMPADLRDNSEWRYFRARALEQLGRSDRATAIYDALAKEPGYFGFLAADRRHTDYALCPLRPTVDASAQHALLAMPGLQRALELIAVELRRPARREWSAALDGADPALLKQAALLAYQRGWYDRAITVFNSGSALRYYEQRFPLVSELGVVTLAQQAGIEPAWAYGILRAESGWTTDARSGADARGLMQLLPAVGAQVAQVSGVVWAGMQSLYDPATNVLLGTRYLAQMAAKFNNAPWLATAAYDAGAAKVSEWIDARGALPPDVFTATIPFKETREYVERVLAFTVIYDWRLHGNALPLRARMPAIGSFYRYPTDEASRIAIGCPATAMPSSPAAAPAAASAAPAASTSHP